MCFFMGFLFVVQVRLETPLTLVAIAVVRKLKLQSVLVQSWRGIELEAAFVQWRSWKHCLGSARKVQNCDGCRLVLSILSSMRRTNFHSSSNTFTFLPGHRLSPMCIPNRGQETFDGKCGRVHSRPGHLHFQAFWSRKTFIILLCFA